MATQDDKLFITKEAFEKYRDVSEHLDDDRVNSSILEAQITDLIGVIGAPLYKLLQDDFTPPIDPDPAIWATPLYENLFDGVDAYKPQGEKYDVIYHGIQPMLTLYAYARYLDLAQINVTRTGAVNYTEEDVSDAPTQAQIKTKVMSARAMAVRYQEDVTKYLETNSADFPSWVNPNEKNKTFNFIKI